MEAIYLSSAVLEHYGYQVIYSSSGENKLFGCRKHDFIEPNQLFCL